MPTVRNFIDQKREEYQPYKRVLRRRHQESFEELWTMAALDAPSIKMADDPDVDWGMLFAICRNQQREIEKLRDRLDRLDDRE